MGFPFAFQAPKAINSIITTWVEAVESGRHTQHELLQVGKSHSSTSWCCTNSHESG